MPGQSQYCLRFDQVTWPPYGVEAGRNVTRDVLRLKPAQHRLLDRARVSGQARWEARQRRQHDWRRTGAQRGKRIRAEGVCLVHEQDATTGRAVQGLGPLDQAGRLASPAERAGQFLEEQGLSAARGSEQDDNAAIVQSI
ncbi:MAG: hypothetical protein ACRYHQ_18855 [Janthinobacterium lividum]